MKLLDLLVKAGLDIADLVKRLEAAALAVPDLAPSLHTLIAKLQAPLDPGNLEAVVHAATSELKDIAQLKIVSKDHPGGLI